MALQFWQRTIDQYAVDYVYYVRDDGQSGWFIPFQDQRCWTVEALRDTHLLAIGAKGDVTIFDCVAARRTTTVKGLSHSTSHRPRAVSLTRPVVYIAEGQDRANAVREIAFDGSGDRSIPLSPEFSALTMGARADGRINLFGMLEHLRPGTLAADIGLVILDPATGRHETARWPFRNDSDFSFNRTGLNWFSPSGDYVLRRHLGSIPRHAPSTRSALSGLFGRRAQSFEGHPDLIADGQTRYGIALDVYTTKPFALATRVVTRFLTITEIVDRAARSSWDHDRSMRFIDTLDHLADSLAFDAWDGKSQVLFASASETDEAKRREIEERDLGALFLVGQIKNVVWDADGLAMTVFFEGATQRRISHDGTIGPLQRTVDPEWYEVPPAIAKAVRKTLRDRHEQRIPINNLGEAECVKAITKMGALVDAGLEHIVHRDNLTFVFPQGGGNSLSEEDFFAHVGANCPSAVPALRALLISFGRQAADTLKWEGGEQITTGSEAEDRRTALAYAALALAKLDSKAYEALTGWFDHVDQEHDGFAANTVFPAMAAKTGWSSPDFVRFAIRFFMRLYAVLEDDTSRVAMMQTLRQNWPTADFAKVVTEEAVAWREDRRKYAGGDELTLDMMMLELKSVFDDAVPWDRTAQREIAFALRVAQGPTSPWGNKPA